MAQLQDLFVSYKSVRPEKTNENKTTESSFGFLPQDLTRVQSILTTDTVPGSIQADDAISTVWEADDAEETPPQPREFKWINTQLRTAWKDNVAPLGYQSPTPQVPYRGLTGAVTPYNRGNLAGEIEELFKAAGINIRVTSGTRAPGEAGKAGDKSHHTVGNACDIVPGDGETYETIRQKMAASPDILRFFYENGLGVIDETDPKTRKKTGATGAHYHIGPDKWAVKTWQEWQDSADAAQAAGQSSSQPAWTRNMYKAFLKALRKRYKDNYPDDHLQNLAYYMTCQSAMESGYGTSNKHFNYGGHGGDKTLREYNSMDEYAEAHLDILDKWNAVEATSLQDFVNRIHDGKYKYSEITPESYYTKTKGTMDRVSSYLGIRFRCGGKFGYIRTFHAKSFS